MTEESQRCRVLVVEDEYLLGEELRRLLVAAGIDVIGPLPSLNRAIATLDHISGLDAAVLDINLAGQLVFPVAERLQERGVPFVFLTGYGAGTIPPRFASVPVLEKPADLQVLLEVLGQPR
jgi:DNA-binding response OmpR family regulator